MEKLPPEPKQRFTIQSTGRSTTQTPAPLATSAPGRPLKAHDVLLSPTLQSAIGIEAWSKHAGEIDLAELSDGLHKRAKALNAGDLQPVEVMLLGQAVTLDGIFNGLARQAANQDQLKPLQAYMVLALKAQSQCRATLEALAEIKNPHPVAFVKQANISGGPQQVNNGGQPAQDSLPGQRERGSRGKSVTPEIELLEAPHGNRLDNRAQGATGRADSDLEAVGSVHRTTHP